MTRSELMERMSANEFFEWMIMEQIEPFGDKRGDIQAGLIAQIIANIHRDPNKDPYQLEDFLPQFEERKKLTPEQSPEDQMAFMLALQAKQNKTVQ